MIDIHEYEAEAGDVDEEGFGPIVIAHRASGKAVVVGYAGVRDRVLEVTELAADASLSQQDVIALFVLVYLFQLTNDAYRALADRVSLSWADGSKTVTFNYPAPITS